MESPNEPQNPSPVKTYSFTPIRSRIIVAFCFLILAFAAELQAQGLSEKWRNTFGSEGVPGGSESSTKIISDNNGNIIVAGSGMNGFAILRKHAASDGAVAWNTHYRGPEGYQGFSIKQLTADSQGNVYALGTLSVYQLNASLGYGGIAVAKFSDGDGSVVWCKTIDALMALGSGIRMDSNGNLQVLSQGYDARARVTRYRPSDGHVISSITKQIGDVNIHLDPDGDVIYAASGSAKKYSGVDLSLLWEKGGSPYIASYVAKNGDVFVKGSEYGDRTETLKYKIFSHLDGTTISEGIIGSWYLSSYRQFYELEVIVA